MPIDLDKNLRQRCKVISGDDGDSFVGVKADTEDAFIYFPIGYNLPEDEVALRVDVHNLFGVLAAFMKEDKVIEARSFEAPLTVDFPIHAYLKIITMFLRTGRYYIETDPVYVTATKGNTSWPRTIKEQLGLMQKNGSLIYTQMTVRSVTPNADKQITQIHRFCVYEAFDKLGWLYVPFKPEEPGPHPTIRESIFILTKKLAASHNDNEQDLFRAMKNMLEYLDEKSSERQFFFGTDYFERIWERMIDKAFGIEDKSTYFPRTRWLLDHGRDREKTPLYPDYIMIFRGKYYVLDSKCYRYGWTGDFDHLPNGADISKQITYGEYIARTRHLPNDRLFNAFIMPYNMAHNLFHLSNAVMGNIGEAVGDWKTNMCYYERIQGIVIDTRYLMYNYIGMPETRKQELADCIGRVITREPVPEPHIR